MIFQRLVTVVGREEVAEGIFALSLESAEVANSARPGQFINVRFSETALPLLRRPFSISRVDGSSIELLFNVIGQGTRLLASKRIGDRVDVLGPLGIPFGHQGGFDTAVIVAGGLGIAPFPFLTGLLKREKKRIATFVGAKTARPLVTRRLDDVQVATDDGSEGFRGTVVELLERNLSSNPVMRPKMFGCGPTPMLKALSAFAQEAGIECELSLEGDMACGVGLCQGCPVERANGRRKYALVCVEGPTFNCKEIVLR